MVRLTTITATILVVLQLLLPLVASSYVEITEDQTWRPLVYDIQVMTGRVSDSYPTPTIVIVFDEENFSQTAFVEMMFSYYSPHGPLTFNGSEYMALNTENGDVMSIATYLLDHDYDSETGIGHVKLGIAAWISDQNRIIPGYYEYTIVFYFLPPGTGYRIPYPYTVPLAIYVYPDSDEYFHAENAQVLGTTCFGLPLTFHNGIDILFVEKYEGGVPNGAPAEANQYFSTEELEFDDNILEVTNRYTYSTYPFYVVCFTFRVKEKGEPNPAYTKLTETGFETNITWKIKYITINGEVEEFEQNRTLILDETKLKNQQYLGTRHTTVIYAPGFAFFVYQQAWFKPKSISPIDGTRLIFIKEHRYWYDYFYAGVLVYEYPEPVLRQDETYIGAIIDNEEYRYKIKISPYNGEKIGGSIPVTWFVGEDSIIIWYARINATYNDRDAENYKEKYGADGYSRIGEGLVVNYNDAEEIVFVKREYRDPKFGRIYYMYGIAKVTGRDPKVEVYVWSMYQFVWYGENESDVRYAQKTFETTPHLIINLKPKIEPSLKVIPIYSHFIAPDLSCISMIFDANLIIRGDEIDPATVHIKGGSSYSFNVEHFILLSPSGGIGKGYYACIKMNGYPGKDSHNTTLTYEAKTFWGSKLKAKQWHVIATETRIILRPIYVEKRYQEYSESPMTDPYVMSFQPIHESTLYLVYLGLLIKEGGSQEDLYIYPYHPLYFSRDYKVGGRAWFTLLPMNQWEPEDGLPLKKDEAKHLTVFDGKEYRLPKPYILLHSGVVTYPFKLTDTQKYFYNFGDVYIATDVCVPSTNIQTDCAHYINKTIVRFNPPMHLRLLLLGYPEDTEFTINLTTDWWGEWDWLNPSIIIDYAATLFDWVDLFHGEQVTEVPAENAEGVPELFLFYASAVFMHRVHEVYEYTRPYPLVRVVHVEAESSSIPIFCIPFDYAQTPGLLPPDFKPRCGSRSVDIYVPRLTRGLRVEVYAKMGYEGVETIYYLEEYYASKMDGEVYDPYSNIAVVFGRDTFRPEWDSDAWIRVGDAEIDTPSIQRRCTLCDVGQYIEAFHKPPWELTEEDWGEVKPILPANAKLLDYINVTILVPGPIYTHSKIAIDKYLYAKTLRDDRVTAPLPYNLSAFVARLREYYASSYPSIYREFGVPLYVYGYRKNPNIVVVARACGYWYLSLGSSVNEIIRGLVRSPDKQLIEDYIYANKTEINYDLEKRCSELLTPEYVYGGVSDVYIRTVYGEHAVIKPGYIGYEYFTETPPTTTITSGAATTTTTPPSRGGEYVWKLILVGIAFIAVIALYLAWGRIEHFVAELRRRLKQSR